jgi:hypothetical protein
MPFVPVAGTVEAELLMQLDSENVENTLYFEKAGAWTVTQLQDLGAALKTWWQAWYRPPQSNSLAFRGVRLTDLSSANAAGIEIPSSPFLFGEQNTEAMSSNVAPCISFRTASRGRSFRGRNYIAGIPITVVTQNTVTSDWLTAMAAGYNALIGMATEQGCTWVVVSRYSGMGGTPRKPIPRAAGVTTPVIAASFTDATVDSQRRRLPKH